MHVKHGMVGKEKECVQHQRQSGTMGVAVPKRCCKSTCGLLLVLQSGKKYTNTGIRRTTKER